MFPVEQGIPHVFIFGHRARKLNLHTSANQIDFAVGRDEE